MESEIVVSICCITYNHENYIEDALNGFLNQKVNFKYEILIHDDASTDRTSEILKEYEKKYPELIKVIYQNENQYSKGKYVSRFLYERAKGKYIAKCEGDDYWINENKLQKQVDFLEKNFEYIATYHNVLVVDKEKKRMKNYQHAIPLYQKHDLVREDIKKVYVCGHTSSIVCRNFWKNWSEEEKDEYCSKKAPGDGKISLVFLLTGKVYFFEEICSCYRLVLEGESWTSKAVKKNLALMHYNFLLELEKLARAMFKFNYEIDINRFILDSFRIFLKEKTYSNFKIFCQFLIKRKSILDLSFYILKKMNNKRKKNILTNWPLLQCEEKYLKGTLYEN
ncbi:glycosyltransferase family 2 protein (plasmid) [Cetobacterium somerae]|uniref:glycosyltransferase family 2 protein n=1 Tax=Cetobacterium somerae TaxID=188913 RepID=UPI003D768CBF